MMPKYICAQQHASKLMFFVRVEVTQPVAGNPNVNMVATWKCPECENEMNVVLSWDAEKEVMT